MQSQCGDTLTGLDLGAQTLRGVAEPVAVYRVLRESGVHSRLDIASARGLTPLVGREQEVGLLLECWEQVKAGQGHVVLLTGVFCTLSIASVCRQVQRQLLRNELARFYHHRARKYIPPALLRY